MFEYLFHILLNADQIKSRILDYFIRCVPCTKIETEQEERKPKTLYENEFKLTCYVKC